MRQIINKYSVFMLFVLATASAPLFSFTGKTGGDSFEIYLNKKLVLQQFVSQSSGVKTLYLDQSNSDGQLDIYYSHCGRNGIARNITIKDGQNHLLKEWHFSDVKGDNKSMTCKVKEILSLQQFKNGNKLNIYYSSQQLPNGRLLASIIFVNKNKANTRP